MGAKYDTSPKCVSIKSTERPDQTNEAGDKEAADLVGPNRFNYTPSRAIKSGYELSKIIDTAQDEIEDSDYHQSKDEEIDAIEITREDSDINAPMNTNEWHLEDG